MPLGVIFHFLHFQHDEFPGIVWPLRTCGSVTTLFGLQSIGFLLGKCEAIDVRDICGPWRKNIVTQTCYSIPLQRSYKKCSNPSLTCMGCTAKPTDITSCNLFK
ncbi:hypothetical protein NPIL_184101 [Nephila pilipes]|uniref:Uncharacterized protein n=1 Tax=Nephila pilipes TaxID=299642 RepID=A0A8X6PSV8_NEPPI|nr:hypothetical protein NPIL_184101 [Nephila pilipes]